MHCFRRALTAQSFGPRRERMVMGHWHGGLATSHVALMCRPAVAAPCMRHMAESATTVGSSGAAPSPPAGAASSAVAPPAQLAAARLALEAGTMKSGWCIALHRRTATLRTARRDAALLAPARIEALSAALTRASGGSAESRAAMTVLAVIGDDGVLQSASAAAAAAASSPVAADTSMVVLAVAPVAARAEATAIGVVLFSDGTIAGWGEDEVVVAATLEAVRAEWLRDSEYEWLHGADGGFASAPEGGRALGGARRPLLRRVSVAGLQAIDAAGDWLRDWAYALWEFSTPKRASSSAPKPHNVDVRERLGFRLTTPSSRTPVGASPSSSTATPLSAASTTTTTTTTTAATAKKIAATVTKTTTTTSLTHPLEAALVLQLEEEGPGPFALLLPKVAISAAVAQGVRIDGIEGSVVDPVARAVKHWQRRIAAAGDVPCSLMQLRRTKALLLAALDDMHFTATEEARLLWHGDLLRYRGSFKASEAYLDIESRAAVLEARMEALDGSLSYLHEERHTTTEETLTWVIIILIALELFAALGLHTWAMRDWDSNPSPAGRGETH